MLKFIHTADWQIGMKAAHVGAAGQQVRDARLEAARRVIEAGKDNQAQFIAITGDTFEDNAVDRVLVQKVADLLGTFDGPVFIIPGNHDPLTPGSVWQHAAWRSHANVHVLHKTEPLALDGVTLYPCPLYEKHSRRDPTHWIDAKAEKTIAVGLAHGTVEGIMQDQLQYPISRNAADRAGLDYVAIGHWHSTAFYRSSDGAERMAYSGTPETTKFGERDSGNILLVEIAGRGAAPVMTRIHTGVLAWKTMERRIVAIDDLARTRREIETLAPADKTILNLQLHGVLHPDQQEELTRVEEIMRARFLYGRIDDSQLRPAPEDESWLALLPVGVIREVAERLTRLGNPAVQDDRPDYATPEVARRALLDLYRMTVEAQR